MTISTEWWLKVLGVKLYKAEQDLGLTGKDLYDRQLPTRDRAREILRAASRNPAIEPNTFVLAWLLAQSEEQSVK
jgi:hypothetical protein